MEKKKVVISDELVEKVVEKLKEETKQEFIRIKIDDQKETTLTGSKVGGTPYWKNIENYPKDKYGNPLTLMAQINLAELPENDKLPKQGLLQFFFLMDDLWGMNFDEPDDNNGFRVIYHPEIDESTEPLEDIPTTLTACEGDEMSPINGCFGIDFSVDEDILNFLCYNFPNKFFETAKEMKPDMLDGCSATDINIDNSEMDCDACGHKLFGYPYFTQSDPREWPEMRKYDTLLFQLDSEDDYIMFGDCGVANFFINSEDLKKLDFSKVLYNWDCC